MLPIFHHRRICQPRIQRVGVAVLASLSLALMAGCSDSKKPKGDLSKLTSRYQSQALRVVPPYMRDTILERCDIGNIEPFPVSGFGLVSGLHNTGDSFAGTAVREYMIKQMVTHGFGSRMLGMERVQPETVLRDPSMAIVRVDGFIPPGARKHQRFDVFASALDGNNTSSLAHGRLYDTELKINGANVQAPGYTIDIWASGAGEIFVNPAYAMRDANADSEARASLRQGVILGGGVVKIDRPLVLKLRQPSLALSRMIDFRIDKAFQDQSIASAKDEALVALYVPEKYGNDWEHFVQVVAHLYLNSSPEFASIRAKQLVEEAVKPNAPLLDISYCWEAFGPTVLPTITPLIASDKADVAYAAARAAAFLGDNGAQNALIAMAGDDKHPFQQPAVVTLAKLPSSPLINGMLRRLLDSEQNLVRLEAYRALVEHEDPSIISRPIAQPGGNPAFTLDVVPSKASPIVYATRTGQPRIALIGSKMQVDTPILFTAMENRFSISSDEQRSLLNVFYRGPELRQAVSVISSPDAVELVSRLGGEGAPGQPRLQFGYCDVVSLLQAMVDKNGLTAQVADGRMPAKFVLQEPPKLEKAIEDAPTIPEPPTQAAVDAAAISAASPGAK